MHYYPEDQSEENLKKIRRSHVCAECGRQLAIYYDLDTKRQYIACSGQRHEGIVREYHDSEYEHENSIRRLMELEKSHGPETTRALAKLPTKGQLTTDQAEHILSLVYPGCPKDEIVRCAILCRDFGLHPLMKEVYLIPFKDKSGKENYATVLGINATRKLMAQRGTFSYLDMTPRLMNDEEQKAIFGEVDARNFVAITKLRTREGEEAQGYGKWPKDKQPYGTDKGNTIANMAFIRSERNAFGRLFTDAIPQNVEIVDEAYVEGVGVVDKKTGEVIETIEGEATELPPIEQTEPEPESDPEKPDSIVNLEWLKETLGELQKRGLDTYSDESMLNYMKISYKVEGKDVYEAASKLDKGKAAHLCKALQDALDKA